VDQGQTQTQTQTSWSKVVLVCAAGVPAAIALGKISLVAPLVQAELGLSLPQLGWATSTITAVAALFGTPAGLWSGRYGARRTLLAGLVVMAMAGGAGAVARGLVMLLAARVVEGVGYLLVVVAAPALLVCLTTDRRGGADRDRAAALAGWGAVIPLGFAIGAAAGGTLAQAIGWRGWLGLSSVLPLAAAVAVAVAIPPDPDTDADPHAAAPAAHRPHSLGSWPPRSARSRSPWSGLGRPMLLAGGFCGLCVVGIAVLSLLPSWAVLGPCWARRCLAASPPPSAGRPSPRSPGPRHCSASASSWRLTTSAPRRWVPPAKPSGQLRSVWTRTRTRRHHDKAWPALLELFDAA